MLYDESAYGQVAELDTDWMKSQASKSSFLKLKEGEDTPVLFVRSPVDRKFSTDKLLVHHYNDPSTQKYYRIPCAATLGQRCRLCELRNQAMAAKKFDRMPLAAQKVLRVQARYVSQVIDMTPVIDKVAQFKQALVAGDQQTMKRLVSELSAYASKADVLVYDYPKSVYIGLSGQIQASKRRFGRMIDISDPRGLPVVWIKSVPPEDSGKSFLTYEVQLDGTLRIPIDPAILSTFKGSQELFETAMASLPEWDTNKINGILAGRSPDMPAQLPTSQTAATPAVSPGLMGSPPSGPSPFDGPPVTPGATVSAADMPCVGQFNAGAAKCSSCGQKDACLDAIRGSAAAKVAPLKAPPIMAPTSEAVSKADEAVAKALAALEPEGE